MAKKWSAEIVIEEILARHNRNEGLNAGSVNASQLYFQARKYFGSWENAIIAAGLDYEKIRRKESWDKKKVLNTIRDFHSKGKEINAGAMQEEYQSLYHFAREYFGSWKSAIEAAGIDYKIISKRSENRRCICKAQGCYNTFLQRVGGRPKEYCSPKCRDREKRRRRALGREEKGLCPQCGGEMDYPASAHKNKTSPRYCSKCQEYFRYRYKFKIGPHSN